MKSLYLVQNNYNSQSNKDDTIILELQVSHNTHTYNFVIDKILFFSFAYQFFSFYGVYYYGLRYEWVEDGNQVYEERVMPSNVQVFLL